MGKERPLSPSTMGRWTAGSVHKYLRKPGAHKWIYFSYQNFPEIALIGKLAAIRNLSKLGKENHAPERIWHPPIASPGHPLSGLGLILRFVLLELPK